MTDLYRQLDVDLEDGLRIRSSLADIERRMAARLPDALAAASYDRGPASTSIAWCLHHDQEVVACRRAKRPCKGVPDPRHSDRTGNAVTNDVRLDAFEFQDAADMLHVAVARMATIARRYGRDDLIPEEIEASEHLEVVNTPKCQNHLRHGYEVDARTKEPSRLFHKGIPLLPSAMRLCRYCQDQVIANVVAGGRAELPTASDIRRHAHRTGLDPVQLPRLRPVDVDIEAGVAHVAYAS